MPYQANWRLPGGTEASAEHARVHLDNRRDGLSALIRLLIGRSPKNDTRSARQCEQPIVRRNHLFALLLTLRDTIVVVLQAGGAVLDCWTDGRCWSAPSLQC